MKPMYILLYIAVALLSSGATAEDFTGTKEVRLIHGDLGSPKATTVVIRDRTKIDQLVAAIKLEKKEPYACDHIDHAVFVKGKGEITVSLCDHCFDIGKDSYRMSPEFYRLYTSFVKGVPAPQPTVPIEVYFSPNGGCTDAILREIHAAKSSVLVQAYWFTSARIAKALVEAHKRGVKVEVVLDLSRAEIDNTQADVLVEGGVPTFIDDKHTTAHSKVIIFDGQVVITGSFNFTEQAERENLENLLVIRDKAIAGKFTTNWDVHRGHSGRYGKR